MAGCQQAHDTPIRNELQHASASAEPLNTPIHSKIGKFSMKVGVTGREKDCQAYS